MDNRRMILLAAFAGIVFLLWQAWQQDYPGKTKKQSSSPVAAQHSAADRQGKPTPPAQQKQAAENKQKEGVRTHGMAAVPSQKTQTTHQDEIFRTGKTITVTTDLLKARISTHGASLVGLKLLKYSISKDHADQAMDFLNTKNKYFFIAESGLTAQNGVAPGSTSSFEARKAHYALTDGADTLSVPLVWHGKNGRTLTKTFVFHRDSYQVEVKQDVSNGKGAPPWKVGQYAQFWRTPHTQVKNPRFLHAFKGVSMYQEKGDSDSYKYHKTGFDDLDDKSVDRVQKAGWIAMDQHYFLAAAIPPKSSRVRYYAKPQPLPGGNQKAYVAGFVGPQTKLKPGEDKEFHTKMFIGPKLQTVLPKVTSGLGLSVDYSYFTVIAQPVFWILNKIHSVVGNWGWSIVLITLLMRLAFYKLTEAQYRSMARMKKFGPRMKQIKERFSDDKEKMQKAMMDLYKKEGFNPLGGCWPMVFQFPVFIALYWVLRSSVELRQAPWIFWIHNLAAPDPLYILPVLYGISMFFQQRLSGNNMAMDDMQRKMMMFMPVGLAVFFTFFPAGLVLYWLVSNLVGITQQWFITRRIEQAPAKR